jgi:Fe-S cluster assembly iron-binding protein IscA
MVDKEAAGIIRGSKIDYYESLQRTGFRIENPNVQGEGCGCGGH